jgi:hypothetical protein
MAEQPQTTDVFKFVAVRPPNLADTDGNKDVIRDERERTPEGKRELGKEAEELAKPRHALEVWNRLDLSDLTKLARGQAQLVRTYTESNGANGGVSL